MNLRKIKKVHFIGVGGIGVSAVANMMLDLGKAVSGSDVVESKIIKELKKKGLIFYLGHKSENLAPDIDLVVYSPAIPMDNPERQKAKKLDILEFSYPQMLGQMGKDRKVVAVSGTNGKTTTTSLLGLILEAAHEDPLVIVGSKVKSFKEGNLRLGEGKYFVVEACEYRAHMLNLDPQIIVITNIEEDHLDYYKNLEHIIETFQKYVDKLPSNGLLILNNDDPVSREKIQRPKCKVATYGIENKADVMAKNIRVEGERQYFDLICSGQKIEITFSLQVPGLFNIYNALAATAAALELGVTSEIIKKVLENFTGTWRRFEKVGERGGAIIISDYAHHPTSLQGTIRAAKDFYPERRLIVVFQPHQRNRTKNLFQKFIKSFAGADIVILSEIYDVAGREEAADQDISSKDIARELEKHYGDKFEKILFACHLEETTKLVLENIKPNDLVLVMGAGDIFRVAEELVESKK